MQITCSRCGVAQDESEFFRAPSKPTGRQSSCKTCCRKMKAAWAAGQREEIRAKNREYRRQRFERDPVGQERRERNERLKSMFGITLDDYEKMFEAQHGLCGICDKPSPDRRLAVDHDRRCCPGKKSCGKCVRGLLCGSCNPKLGFYEIFEEKVAAWRDYRSPARGVAG